MDVAGDRGADVRRDRGQSPRAQARRRADLVRGRPAAQASLAAKLAAARRADQTKRTAKAIGEWSGATDKATKNVKQFGQATELLKETTNGEEENQEG